MNNQKQNKELDDLLKLEPKIVMPEVQTDSKKGEDLEIHTIPEKFKKPSGPTKKKSKTWLWVVLIILFLAIVAGAAYYFASTYSPQSTAQPSTQVEQTQPETNIEPEEKIEPEFVSARQNLSSSVEDEDGLMILQMQLVIDEGALEEDYNIEITPNLSVSLFDFVGYDLIEAVFELNRPQTKLEKNAQLTFSYVDDVVEEQFEKDLKIGVYSNGSWQEIESQVDIVRNTVKVDIDNALGQKYALVLNQDVYEAGIMEVGVSSIIDIKKQDTLDTDEDGLTDIEENVFTTNINNKDTDGDSYDDRTELLNLYSPKQGPGSYLLAETNLVDTYEVGEKYQVLVPRGFVVAELGSSLQNLNIMFTTDQADFFRITSQSKSGNLSVKDWYLMQMPNLAYDDVEVFEVNGMNAVLSQDSATVFVEGEDMIYIISYGIEDLEEISFETTFEMFVNSFEKIEDND